MWIYVSEILLYSANYQVKNLIHMFNLKMLSRSWVTQFFEFFCKNHKKLVSYEIYLFLQKHYSLTLSTDLVKWTGWAGSNCTKYETFLLRIFFSKCDQIRKSCRFGNSSLSNPLWKTSIFWAMSFTWVKIAKPVFI